MELYRVVTLQISATQTKLKALRVFSDNIAREYNWLLSQREGCSSFKEFHSKTYLALRNKTGYAAQLCCTLIRDSYRMNSNHVRARGAKFNIPRVANTFSTKSKFFVELRYYAGHKIAVPIKQNNSFTRFQKLVADGWKFTAVCLTSNLEIDVYLHKAKEIVERPNMLGIDVNVKCFAISIVSPEGKVLYQTYLGKNIYTRRTAIMLRRSRLQSVGATKKLEQLGRKEKHYVENNLGNLIAQIVQLADKYDAEISIEKLQRFQRKRTSFNRKVMRMPFYQFKENLIQRCFDRGIPLHIIDPYHTSKWCSHCGAVGDGHSSNYSLYKCVKCGQVVNSDRKASLAIAVKSLLERNKQCSNQPCYSFQFSKRQVPASGLFRPDEVSRTKPVENVQLAKESSQKEQLVNLTVFNGGQHNSP